MRKIAQSQRYHYHMWEWGGGNTSQLIRWHRQPTPRMPSSEVTPTQQGNFTLSRMRGTNSETCPASHAGFDHSWRGGGGECYTVFIQAEGMPSAFSETRYRNSWLRRSAHVDLDDPWRLFQQLQMSVNYLMVSSALLHVLCIKLENCKGKEDPSVILMHGPHPGFLQSDRSITTDPKSDYASLSLWPSLSESVNDAIDSYITIIPSGQQSQRVKIIWDYLLITEQIICA